MKKFFLLLIPICGLGVLGGCGNGLGAPPPPPPVMVATHFSVTPATSAPTAGTPFNFAVTALDSSNNTYSSYSGTIHFTSTDAKAVLPADASLTNGTANFSATLKTAGPQTITAADGIALTGISNSIVVSAGPATRISVTGPTTASAGFQIHITVTAFDAYANIATGYSGTVQFSSSDAQAALPPNSPLASGTGIFPVTLKSIANETITATDTATAALTGGSSPIAVVSNAATHFTITTPSNATTRATFKIFVGALDAANNPSIVYSGTVKFTSTDNQAQLPPSSVFTITSGFFFATLETAGSQTLTVTDTVTPSLTGVSPSILVSAASALAISSGTPPSGNYGVTYGPITNQYRRCAYSGRAFVCTPCNGSAGCTSLPPCRSRNAVYPCLETIPAHLGFPLTAIGGVPPYIWSVLGLPPGLGETTNLRNGYLSGNPTVPGSYPVSISVADSGTPQVSTPASSYTIVIDNPRPPVIDSANIPPAGTLNIPYAFTFVAGSTAPPLNWRLSPTSGALPAGLTLNQNGSLSGTPTVGGTFSITLIAEDTFKQDSTPQTFNIQIFAHGFKATGSMATTRVEYIAILLSTGKVLVAGGIDATGHSTSEAELYDPSTGSFSTTGSMGTARAYFAASLLCNLAAPPCADDRVLLTGGIDINGNTLQTAEIYDPATGTFSSTTGSMRFVHASHTSTLLNDGFVLITGWGSNVAELFNPSTKTFAVTGNLATGRVSHTATLLNNGKVLIAGGIQGVPPTTKVLAEAELYDPATGLFSTTLNSMTTARQWHTATLLTDGKVLITGGADSNGIAFGTAELFDPSNQTFTATKGNMIDARGLQTATLLNDGTVLVTGGTSGTAALSSAELYDPIAGIFSLTGNMSTVRQQHTATMLNDGTVLVTGTSATAELYQ